MEQFNEVAFTFNGTIACITIRTLTKTPYLLPIKQQEQHKNIQWGSEYWTPDYQKYSK